MKYRGLTYDKSTDSYKWVYGLPSYGFETEEIAEIGTPQGDFYDIDPATLGEETDYRDRHGKPIYTGDITTLKVNGEVREFVVDRATVDREYNALPGFKGETVKVESITYNRMTEAQMNAMEAYHEMGAECFVLVSFSFCDFYRIPWTEWNDMPMLYGRKYMKRCELEKYRIKEKGNILYFLDGLEAGAENG